MLGDTPRTQLTVDRVSKTLVERLLAEAIPPKKEIKIQCYKRYVGKKSFVESSVYIPKKLILRTSRELDEHIQVKVVRGRKHAF